MRECRRGRSPRIGKKLTCWPLASVATISTLIMACRGLVLLGLGSIRAVDALEAGDTLIITTLDRLGRSTQNMLGFAVELRDGGAGLRVLNLGGGDVDTSTPMGSMLFTIMAARAQMEHDSKKERIVDSISKRREAGKDLGGRPQRVTDSQIRNAMRLVEGGEPAAQVARDLGMSRATFYRRSRAFAD